MAALHDLCWDFLFSCQMNCKQHIVLNHVFFRYESNLEPVTFNPLEVTSLSLSLSVTGPEAVKTDLAILRVTEHGDPLPVL